MIAPGKNIYFHTLCRHSRCTFGDVNIHSASIANSGLLKWAGVDHQHGHATFHVPNGTRV
jgi:hypothetical protein